jgi:hypothetical protein
MLAPEPPSIAVERVSDVVSPGVTLAVPSRAAAVFTPWVEAEASTAVAVVGSTVVAAVVSTVAAVADTGK